MSTNVLADRATTEAPPREPRTAPRPGGLLWLSWRQSRTALWAIAALVVTASATLLWLHFSVQPLMADLRRAGCSDGASWSNAGCQGMVSPITRRAYLYTTWLQPALVAVPLLIGMFLGAPMLAQEYERGTVRLAWTQSVSPLRWLTARIALPGLAVLAAGGVLAVLATWVWNADIAHSPFAFDPPFQGLTYPVLGVVPVAWSLFALALGLLVGQLLRRTVASVLATGVLVAVVHGLLRWGRASFYPSVKEMVPRGVYFGQPTNAWLVDRGVVLQDGRWASDQFCWDGDRTRGCEGATSNWIEYHPVGHFVPIQLVETGILVALTVVALTVLFLRVRRDGNSLRATRRA
ncbi:hypothetical protein ACFV6D_23075 [Kitasatospora sp. NPDC059812]|uniref:hypothetical protein n=1 Tax=Kitasatospora sp. NPDC059812 TaxID=3346958 RepID=UPI003668DA60